MTHLSDGSYMQRLVALVIFLLMEIYTVWYRDRFRAICVHKSKHAIKGAATIILLISQILMIAYDALAAYVKYIEGFSIINGAVLPKPSSAYSLQNQKFIQAANSILNVSWALKTSALFLALAVWNFAVCNLVNLKHFGKSFEFRTYIVYSIISFTLYPILAEVFSNNVLFSTVVPQFVYHFECVTLAVLMIFTNYRFNEFCQGKNPDVVVVRIKSYIGLNYLLICAALLDGLSLFVINLDIVLHPTASSKRLVYNSKIATDILTVMFSCGFVVTYPLAILNLYPTSNRLTTSQVLSKSHGVKDRSKRGSPPAENTDESVK